MNFFLKIHLIAFLLVFQVCSISAQCISSNSAFSASGETLKYAAYFNWKAIWVKGGEAVFRAEQTGNFYHFSVQAYSMPKWRWVYDLNTKIDAYMNRHTMQAVSYASNTCEDKHWKREKITFWTDKVRYVQWSDSYPKGEQSVVTRHACAYDLLNEVYAARNVDLLAYKPGQNIPFNVYFTQKLTTVYGKVIGPETIITKNGKKYDCLKCMSNSIPGSIFDSSEPVVVWLTNDARHIPVCVQCKIKVGYIKVYLEN